MFTTPAPAAPTLSTTTSPASPTSPSRPSRLRGLSYLRNYTHGLHSSLAAGSSSSGITNSSSRASATAAAASSRAAAAPSPTALSNTTTTRPRSLSGTPDGAPASSRSFAVSSVSAVAGQSGTSLYTTTSLGEQTGSRSSVDDPSSSNSTMTRLRAESAAPQLSVRNPGPTPANNTNNTNMTAASSRREANPEGSSPSKHLPSIKLIPFQDPGRVTRPSLQFPPITRTLPDENCVIKVGRYSERDNVQEEVSNVLSSAAIGFKSKVVSRKHCELWCQNSQWYIKDVKSSSGTFLNHIRLSQPNTESKPYPLKDGDMIQLGIDYRGGEEVIYRCVKIRVECNRGWQQGLNKFNKQTHQRLRNLGKPTKDGDGSSTYTAECTICLMSVAPCQSLFVAPCSHVWHYKCIRPILNGPTHPNFLCPNCRAVTDLEADVEEPDAEDWEDEEEIVPEIEEPQQENALEERQATPRAAPPAPVITSASRPNTGSLSDLEAALASISMQDSMRAATSMPSTPDRPTEAGSSSVTQPVSINVTSTGDSLGGGPLFRAAATSDGLTPDRTTECPMTPRNDAGPFVLDGSGGSVRSTSGRRSGDESNNTTSARSNVSAFPLLGAT